MAKPRVSRKPAGQKRPPLTHFLCLPLVTEASRPQLEASVKAFKDDVSSLGDASSDPSGRQFSIPSKAIRPVGSLHCTLGVMSLDEGTLENVKNHVRSLDLGAMLRQSNQEQHTQEELPGIPCTSNGGPSTLERPVSPPPIRGTPQPLAVSLVGLESMHGPSRTSVLYVAPGDPTDRLLSFCKALQKDFRERGFLLEDNRVLKLHTTVVNTIYAKRRGSRPAPLDAVDFLKKYQEYTWADRIVLDRVAVCEMGAKKVLDKDGNVVDEVYAEIVNAPMPA